MYPEYMQESIKKVNKTRSKRLEIAKSAQKTGKPIHPMMSDKEREDVLNKFHPDYKPNARKK